MSKENERNLVVGLDIGTSKISVVVGEITPDNQLSIVGVGNQPARGMDKGGVNDLNLVIQSIQRAINEAELMADCQISSVYLGISGKHIRCQNENGMVPINDKEVIQEDVDNREADGEPQDIMDELINDDIEAEVLQPEVNEDN